MSEQSLDGNRRERRVERDAFGRGREFRPDQRTDPRRLRIDLVAPRSPRLEESDDQIRERRSTVHRSGREVRSDEERFE
ncbi:MAG: hypothetical protein ACO3U4_12080, partial [Gemmobacter sp.]